ncbi:MAG TPA: 30S ribosome-binding factor RbfA [Azospirillum sp.]
MSNRPGNRDRARAPSQRQLRVGEELRHALAGLLQRGDFHDPDLLNLNVTVTEVRMSPDLRNATAFVTPLGGGNVDEALAALKRAAPFLRGQIAREVQLRYAPSLSFQGDTSFDYAGHINTILHSPEVARDLGPLGPRVNGDDDDEEDDSWDEEDDDEAESFEYDEETDDKLDDLPEDGESEGGEHDEPSSGRGPAGGA